MQINAFAASQLHPSIWDKSSYQILSKDAEALPRISLDAEAVSGRISEAFPACALPLLFGATVGVMLARSRRVLSKRRVVAKASERQEIGSRRSFALAVSSVFGFAVSLVGVCHAEEVGSDAAASASTGAVFAGRYTDPNHPGGYRQVILLDTWNGEFRDAIVEGGGGRGEPPFFSLKASIGKRVLDRRRYGGTGEPIELITIDFTPKGGPANFPGVWDKDGITFLGDNNHWPKGEVKKRTKKS